MEDRSSTGHFILSIILVAIAAFLQQTEVVRLFGVKPNLALAVTAALVFFLRYPLHYIVVVLVGGLLLKFEPGAQGILVAFLGVSLTMFLLRRLLPSTEIVNISLFSVAGVGSIYLLADSTFFFKNLATVSIEAALTALVAILVHIALMRFTSNAPTLRLAR
jgi:hypothetical protein